MNRNTVWALTLAVLLSGCGYRDYKVRQFSGAATVSPTFSSINSLIIIPKCLRCHKGGGEGGDGEAEDEGDFSSYQGVVRTVRPYYPDSSDFYEEVLDGEMPIGAPSLSDDEVLAIYQWIQNGAKND